MSLSDLGWRVVGPVGTVEKALKLIEDEEIHIALLDYNLVNDTSAKVALKLVELGIPVIFLSGDSLSSRPDILLDMPILTKPISYPKLNEMLKDLTDS